MHVLNQHYVRRSFPSACGILHHQFPLSKSKTRVTGAGSTGHTIPPDGIRPETDKVDALVKLPMPRGLKQLHFLVGALPCCRSFLPRLAEEIWPINSLRL